MLRIAATIVLFLGWHFPTTFFVPASSPYEKGWFVWPFGQQTRPALDALQGVIAPAAVTATGQPTVAMIAAGVSSLAFIVAAGALWGFVVPAAWLQPAAIVGASASLVLFLVYASPLAVIPLIVDLVILWSILSQGWSVATFARA
jgi:hypothetical protein